MQCPPDKSLRRLWHSKVRPGCEVEMSNGSNGVPSHHSELVDVPVGVVRLVQDGDLDVPVEDRIRVERPIVVALLPTLLYTPGQHHDGPRVRLPAHSPEVVPRGVERALRHYELPLRVEAGHEAGVDEVAPLLVVCWLQLHPAVVVWQDVGEPVKSPQLQNILMRQICFFILGTSFTYSLAGSLADPQLHRADPDQRA